MRTGILDIPFDWRSPYDILVTSCGYETRSSYLLRLGVSAERTFAVVHSETRLGSFESNLTLYQNAGWATGSLDAALHLLLDTGARGDGRYRVGIDVSSMPRTTLAHLVKWAAGPDASSCDVEFLYCPADFAGSAEAANVDVALTASPISDDFRGSLRPPSVPVGVILGLGLEPYRAVGVLELLEPSRVWAFMSQNSDSRFVQEALRVNRQILRGTESTLVEYDIRSFASTYASVESLCFGLETEFRLVLAPSGPKIFTVACLLAAAGRTRLRPAVWRVGSLGEARAVDVVEAGEVVAGRVWRTDTP